MVELVRLPDVAMAALRCRSPGDLPRVGKFSVRRADCVIAVGPDEWLVMAPDADGDALLARLAPVGVAIDVSGNRVAYQLTGPNRLDLLVAGCALDVEAFQPGDAVSTLLARAQVILFVQAERFVILPRRSFASYLEAWAAPQTL